MNEETYDEISLRELIEALLNKEETDRADHPWLPSGRSSVQFCSGGAGV